jgi:alkylhydroperoxidase family enzyme
LKEISKEKQMKDGKVLKEEQWAVVSYLDAMMIDIIVLDEVFEGVRKFLDDKQVVELTATVAAINCAARFLRALDVGEFEGK